MSARERLAAVGAILVLSAFASGAFAFETTPAAPSRSPASGFSFPSFFDSKRIPDLPDLREAQRDDAAPERQSAPVVPPLDVDGAAAPKQGKGANDVRDRAEALSSRFGIDDKPAARAKSAKAAKGEPTPRTGTDG